MELRRLRSSQSAEEPGKLMVHIQSKPKGPRIRRINCVSPKLSAEDHSSSSNIQTDSKCISSSAFSPPRSSSDWVMPTRIGEDNRLYSIY